MVTGTAIIQNQYGIHCRPSAVIAKAVKKYPVTKIFVVSADGQRVGADSVMGLLGLGLECGQRVEIQVEGDNAEAVCAEMVALFQEHFDFPR